MKKFFLMVLLVLLVSGLAVADQGTFWKSLDANGKLTAVMYYTSAWNNCAYLLNEKNITFPSITDLNEAFLYFTKNSDSVIRLIGFLDYYYSVPDNTENGLVFGILECYLQEKKAPPTK